MMILQQVRNYSTPIAIMIGVVRQRWSSLPAASLVSGTQTELGVYTRLVLQTPRIQLNAVRLGLIGAFGLSNI